MKNKGNVLFIHTIPSPYRNPFFENFFKISKYNSTVVFMAKRAKNRIWENGDLKFPHKFLPSMTINLRQNDDLIPIWNAPGVPIEIMRGNYDVVVCSGWDSIGSFLAWITCKLLGIPIIIWAGSTANEKSWRRSLMYIPVLMLVRSANALISYGKASRDYLASFGVSNKKIFISYNSVDINFFRSEAEKNKKNKESIIKKLGIKQRTIILFVGQLISRKGVEDLFKVSLELSKETPHAMVWVGHGPWEEKLRELASKSGLKNQYFFSAKTKKETARFYSIADFFVMPTHEDLYSNVVPEALAAGLPVITTYQNGVSYDYIKPGRNGFVYQAKDLGKLKKLMKKMLKAPRLIKKMRKNTWQLVKNFNYNENIKSFESAIAYATKKNN